MHLENFLPAAVYLLAVTALCVAVFKRLGLGAVLGLLVAGIIIGPHTPGPVATTDVETVREFTHIGVVLLLFLIGLEMEPSRLWRMRREVFGLGLSQVLVTGGVLAVYAYFFIPSGWALAIGVGLTFALSSTAFALQMLEERGESASRHGRTSLAILLMQDMAVVPLLALVPLLATGGADSTINFTVEGSLIKVGALVALVVAGQYIIPRFLDFVARHRNMEAFAMVAMLSVLGAAWAMEHIGLSMELGAFTMGLLLSRTVHHHLLIAQIQPFKGLMMSLFFISVGMSIDVSLLVRDFGPILRDVVAIMAIKTVVLFG
ncbi:MAG: cation:proton antiporter, partial [Rhodospirillales bacterium]|nr:cation:proton antiporter [Rhodospirillales bacterium]